MKQLQVLIFAISLFGVITYTASERLPSYMYSIPYNSVKAEIDNPKTHGGLYPDSLKWSRGGEVKQGLQALIACNKKNREYLTSEIIGIRSGIRNISDSTIQLWFAHYSPGKVGIPPNYTLFIDGPVNYRGSGYEGDDVILGGPRKKPASMTSIPAGSVFNPSSDSLFYNSSDGLFKFEVPGVYKMWFTYSFDSIASTLSVPLTVICSDTIEMNVRKPR